MNSEPFAACIIFAVVYVIWEVWKTEDKKVGPARSILFGYVYRDEEIVDSVKNITLSKLELC